MKVYTAGGIQVFCKWYTSAQTGCAGGAACSVAPLETASLDSGEYRWRILDYGTYGYGAWTAFTVFTLP